MNYSNILTIIDEANEHVETLQELSRRSRNVSKSIVLILSNDELTEQDERLLKMLKTCERQLDRQIKIMEVFK